MGPFLASRSDLAVYALWLSVIHPVVPVSAAELLSTLKGTEPDGPKVERCGCPRRAATTPTTSSL
eukprot:1458046-Prymnesium_polylepis.1